jgi:hypothetical protein
MTYPREVKEFHYKDSKGKETDRTVYMIGTPSDKYFGVDLSEFDTEERMYYAQELRNLYAFVHEGIKDLGLKHNFRYFKKDNMVEDG